jgi:hypothetical protein
MRSTIVFRHCGHASAGPMGAWVGDRRRPTGRLGQDDPPWRAPDPPGFRQSEIRWSFPAFRDFFSESAKFVSAWAPFDARRRRQAIATGGQCSARRQRPRQSDQGIVRGDQGPSRTDQGIGFRRAPRRAQTPNAFTSAASTFALASAGAPSGVTNQQRPPRSLRRTGRISRTQASSTARSPGAMRSAKRWVSSSKSAWAPKIAARNRASSSGRLTWRPEPSGSAS